MKLNSKFFLCTMIIAILLCSSIIVGMYQDKVYHLNQKIYELQEQNTHYKDVYSLANHIKSVNTDINDSEALMMARVFYDEADSVKSGSDFALLLAAMAEAESHYRIDKISSAGAKGLCQIMPATGKEYAKKNGIKFSDDSLFNPQFCIKLQAIIMKDLRDEHGLSAALVAYNGGPKHAKNYEKGKKDAIPTESINYIQKVKLNLEKITK